MKLHVKKNDTVVVISGKDTGKTGEVLKVYPKTGKVLVQGVNIVKKHQKPTRANAQGGIIEKEGVEYKVHTYDGGALSGVEVAEALGEDVERVYKTLVTTAGPGKFFGGRGPISGGF